MTERLNGAELMTSDVEHLFVYGWPFVYLLWRNIYSVICPSFNQVVCFIIAVVGFVKVLCTLWI